MGHKRQAPGWKPYKNSLQNYKTLWLACKEPSMSTRPISIALEKRIKPGFLKSSPPSRDAGFWKYGGTDSNQNPRWLDGVSFLIRCILSDQFSFYCISYLSWGKLCFGVFLSACERILKQHTRQKLKWVDDRRQEVNKVRVTLCSGLKYSGDVRPPHNSSLFKSRCRRLITTKENQRGETQLHISVISREFIITRKSPTRHALLSEMRCCFQGCFQTSQSGSK